MTELNTKIELIVSEIIGATRKANTLEDLGKANTNGINDITDLVKNLALSGVVKSLPTKEEIDIRAEKALFRFELNSRGWDDDYITGYEHGAEWIKEILNT